MTCRLPVAPGFHGRTLRSRWSTRHSVAVDSFGSRGPAFGGDGEEVRFNDLVTSTERPDGAATIERVAIETDTRRRDIPENDLQNAGFVRGVFDRKQQRLARSSRRGFLKGSAAAAGATIAAAAAKLPGSPARLADAQGGVTGSYGYRIWTGQCPSYATGQNCVPGCGPSMVCASCCTPNGFFRNDEAAGYRLRPGVCTYSGGAADGWLWSYSGQCGGCSSITYRCHDGLVLNRTTGLWLRAICRSVTQCGGGVAPAPTTPPVAIPTTTPLPSQVSCPPGYTVVNTGQGYICQPNVVTPTAVVPATAMPTPIGLPPTAVATRRPVQPTQTEQPSTAFFISGVIESAIDNGGSVTIKGWLKGPTTAPLDFRVTIDGSPSFAGLANGFRPDVAQGVVNGGQYHGFEATINGVRPGRRQLCVFGVQNAVEKQLSCVVINVSATPGATALPTATVVPTTAPRPTSTTVAVPTPTATTSPPPALGPNVALPSPRAPSSNRPNGAVEVIRANSSRGGAFVSGWAGDADTSMPTIVTVAVDGVTAVTAAATLPRPDVAAALPAVGPTTGYAITVPFDSTGSHEICVSLVDAVDGTAYLAGCRSITGFVSRRDLSARSRTADPDEPLAIGAAVGALEALVAPGDGTIRVQGWLYLPGSDGVAAGYEVVVDGVTVGFGTADQPHQTIAEGLEIDGDHGFDATYPAAEGLSQVQLYASNNGTRTSLLAMRTIDIS